MLRNGFAVLWVMRRHDSCELKSASSHTEQSSGLVALMEQWNFTLMGVAVTARGITIIHCAQ
jgi:hypothetical protein